MQVASIAKTVGKTLHDNSPAILTALAVTGVVSTAYLAVKATPEALLRLRKDTDARENAFQMDGIEVEVRTRLETVKLTWQLYIPALVVGTATVGCIVGANTISAKRQAVGIAAYSLLERGAREYQEKVVETLGRDKEEAVRAEVVRERVEKDVIEGKDILVFGSGKVRCYESFTGRQFMSDKVAIEKAINEVNARMLADDYASLNDLNSILGIPRLPMGDDIGWKSERLLEARFSATLVEEEPCLVLDYNYVPALGFSRVW
jgi:hypothetical protein